MVLRGRSKQCPRCPPLGSSSTLTLDPNKEENLGLRMNDDVCLTESGEERNCILVLSVVPAPQAATQLKHSPQPLFVPGKTRMANFTSKAALKEVLARCKRSKEEITLSFLTPKPEQKSWENAGRKFVTDLLALEDESLSISGVVDFTKKHGFLTGSVQQQKGLQRYDLPSGWPRNIPRCQSE